MEKVWVVNDPDELFRKTSPIRSGGSSLSEKDPAKAYSLSLLFWGGGQLHNDQLVKGTAFLVLMFAFFAGTVLSAVYWDSLLHFLRARGVSLANAFLAAEVLLFCVLFFWAYNAGDAYHEAVKTRKRPFPGVKSRVSPLLCSLLVPGWGQFLNGQPVKGSVFTGFAVFGIFSVISVPAVLVAWPHLEVSAARLFIEGILSVALLFLPLVPVIWIMAVYDAFSVSVEDLKKESLWERIKAANNRLRTQGWERAVLPRFKSTLALGLVLAFLLIVIGYSVPKGYYANELGLIRKQLSEQGMTVLPEFIGRLLSQATTAGK
jgi:TM2 domain-containing membrane protein YozV